MDCGDESVFVEIETRAYAGERVANGDICWLCKKVRELDALYRGLSLRCANQEKKLAVEKVGCHS